MLFTRAPKLTPSPRSTNKIKLPRTLNLKTEFTPKTFSQLFLSQQNRKFSSLGEKSIVKPASKSLLKTRNEITTVPTDILSFKSTLLNTNQFFDIYKNQRREASRVPYNIIYEDERTSSSNSLAYLLSGLAALGLGTLIVYGLSQNEENQASQRLRQSFIYLTSGLGVTALSAKTFFNSPAFIRFATMNPWLSLALTFGGSIATMMIATSIPYENTIPKLLAYYGFNSMIGISLSPVVALGGPLILRAAFATGIVVSSLGAVAAASPEGTFLSWGGPLAIGLGIVFAASLGSIAFPHVSLLNNVCLYGGAGVFSLFVLHDVDKMRMHAKYDRRYDPINNTISLYMDIINLFVRIAQIMSNSNKRK